MKKLNYLILLFVFAGSSYSDDFYIKVYYLNGEKSKDSHSSSETISIVGLDAEYSVKYKGRKGKNQHDTEKTCTITSQDLDNIKLTIEKKQLFVNDSLFQESSKSKSYERYCNIKIEFRVSGNIFTIKINGDVDEFDENPLYKNSVYLITMVSRILKDC